MALFRCSFAWKEVAQPVQIVRQTVPLPWIGEDWRGLPATEQKVALQACLTSDRREGFVLTDSAPALPPGPPGRAIVVVSVEPSPPAPGWLVAGHRLQGSDHLLPGPSTPAPTAPSPARPHRDYLAWQPPAGPWPGRGLLAAAWGDFTAPTTIGTGRASSTAAAEEQRLHLSAATSAALQNLARSQRVTLSTVLQAVWAVLLTRYSGQDDVVFGVTVSGRPPTLPGGRGDGRAVHQYPPPASPRAVRGAAACLAAQAAGPAGRDAAIRIQQSRRYPGLERCSRGHAALQQHRRLRELSSRGFAGARRPRPGSPPRPPVEQTNYPLSLAVIPGPRLLLRLSCSPRLLEPAAARQMLNHLQTLLEGMVAGPQASVGSLPLLSVEEERILRGWSAPVRTSPPDCCVHELFAAQAAHTPDAIALVFGDERMTYRKLSCRANQAGPSSPPGGGRKSASACSWNAPSTRWSGSWGSSRAAPPSSHSTPPIRASLALLLADSGVQVLLTRHNLLPRLPEHSAKIVLLDAERPQIEKQTTNAPDVRVHPDDRADPRHDTSGSTGKPRESGAASGVEQPGRRPCEPFRIDSNSRVLQAASLSLTPRFPEIFCPLTCGGTVYLPRPRSASRPHPAASCARHAITTVTLPPRRWRSSPRTPCRTSHGRRRRRGSAGGRWRGAGRPAVGWSMVTAPRKRPSAPPSVSGPKGSRSPSAGPSPTCRSMSWMPTCVRCLPECPASCTWAARPSPRLPSVGPPYRRAFPARPFHAPAAPASTAPATAPAGCPTAPWNSWAGTTSR